MVRLALALRQAEPVPRIVAEDGLDPVGPVRRLLEKGHALLLELVVRALAVVGLHRTGPELTTSDKCGDGLRGLVVHHRRAPPWGGGLRSRPGPWARPPSAPA